MKKEKNKFNIEIKWYGDDYDSKNEQIPTKK